MKDSKIEWCDHTFNPWEGCAKVSPGCENCYAEARNSRFGGGEAPNWGKGKPRRRTSAANWKQPLRWNRDAGLAIETWEAGVLAGADMGEMPRRPRVFCASLADWLDDEVPVEWLTDLLALIHATPSLDWLLLTKRPENWHDRINQAMHHLVGKIPSDVFYWLADWREGRNFIPHNIWIGTTVEDQPRANERIPQLLKIPANVRFLSCEPLLGPVEFSDVTRRADAVAQLGRKSLDGIHWVICGGESGRAARPMHPDWVRSLRDQCEAACVPFFFKQWGEWSQWRDEECFNIETPVHQFPGSVTRYEPVYRVGKKAAGRLLDDREHGEFPQIGGAA